MSNQNKTNDSLQDDLRRRMNEIDKSSEFNAQGREHYFTPRRENDVIDENKNLSKQKNFQFENYDKNNPTIIKPRKRTNSPFSEEEKKHITESVELIKTEYNIRNKFIKQEEKKHLKNQDRIIKKINKFDRKIQIFQEKGSIEEAAKTIDLKEELQNRLYAIQEDFKNISMTFDQNMSLVDRRKKIYNNALKAQTNRARKIIELRNKSSKKNANGVFHWGNYINESSFVQPDKNAGVPERKRESSWTEEIEKNKNK